MDETSHGRSVTFRQVLHARFGHPNPRIDASRREWTGWKETHSCGTAFLDHALVGAEVELELVRLDRVAITTRSGTIIGTGVWI